MKPKQNQSHGTSCPGRSQSTQEAFYPFAILEWVIGGKFHEVLKGMPSGLQALLQIAESILCIHISWNVSKLQVCEWNFCLSVLGSGSFIE